MDDQHEQDVSPGYPGSAGLGEEYLSGDHPQSLAETIGQTAHDLIHGRAAEIAEGSPELADDPGTGLHGRQDIGLGTADVENSPYEGGAGMPTLESADTPSMTGNDTLTKSAARDGERS